ncbi:apolipoprotein N-acyltransferase [Celeribacter litoreus]|uniref:apolipoprotein N-acyltransferase n=1 Tax=Celeribacter litoreus TaxID=2876714 RepID=UPI001CCDBBF6|nr:apolipoprotein N-acyltransferase [Celeribacter litoreus]MCA0044178.1 apolipoprotein N-acyltransferase [Celeribacter litoreus]
MRLPRVRLGSVLTRSNLLAAIAGIAIALGQAPFGLWPVAFAGLVGAVLLWINAATARGAASTGWLIGTATFLVSLSWIVNPFLVDPWRHAWMIPFALFFMAGGLALFWMLAFFVAKRLRMGVAGLAGLWGAAELLRGHVFTGFPWAMPGYIWIDTPIAHVSALIGPYGLTALSFAVAGLVAAALSQKSVVLSVASAGAVVLAVGAGLMQQAQPLPEDTPNQIRVVQPNAPQHQKWNPEYIPVFYDRALSLTPPEGADLVVWPETSVAALLYAAGPMLREMAAQASPAQVIAGLNRFDGVRGFNSAVVLDPDGGVTQVYDKHHLVPFGEYMPMPGLLDRLGLRAFTAKEGYGYSAGPGPVLFDLGELGKALPLICYEAIFPRDLRVETRPDWLLQMTNDAWFGNFSGPQQSLVQSRFRSIETGLPMVRAANTGISAVIDAHGEVRDAIPLGQSGAFTAALPGSGKVTPYVRWGEWPVLLLLSVLTISGLIPARLARKVSNSD